MPKIASSSATRRLRRNICWRSATRALFALLLFSSLFGCAAGQSRPSLIPGEDVTVTGISHIVEGDPAGPIPAPSLPPSLEAADDAKPKDAESKALIHYQVECVVTGFASPEPASREAASARPEASSGDRTLQAPPEDAVADAAAITDSFEATSTLYLLQDKPPHSLGGLDQRVKSSLQDGLKVLHSLGYYDGEVHGTIEGAGGAGLREAADAPEGGQQEAGRTASGQAVTARLDFITGRQYTLGKSRVETMTDLDLSCDYAAFEAADPDGEALRPGQALPCTLDDVGLPEGSPAVAARVQHSVDLILDEFHNKGYPFARVASTRYVADRSSKKLESEIRIEPGEFVYMGDLELAGSPPVDKEFFANMRRGKKGQPWNQRRIDSWREALQQTGIFKSVSIHPADTAGPDKERAVVVDSEGAWPRTVGASLKYDSSFGVGVEGQWEHRNLTGNGDSLRLDLPLWTDLQQFSAHYRLPFFLRQDQSFIARTALLNQNTDAYKVMSGTLQAGVERRFSRYWSGSAMVSAEGGEIKEPDEPRTSYMMLGLPLTVTYNGANSLLNATEGVRASLTVAPYTGTYYSSFSMLRNRLDMQAFFPVRAFGGVAPARNAPEKQSQGQSQDKKQAKAEIPAADARLVLAWRGSLGAIYGAASADIPTTVRFYSGGGGSVRGYSYQSLGPRNSKDDPLGGDTMLETSLEARLRFTETWGMVAFLDGGNVGDGFNGNLMSDFRWGAGVGLRYYTLIGPVRFDVATPLNPREDDQRFQFYISIGQSF